MEEKKCCCEGKKAANFIVNLVLSFICFAGCIAALVLSETDSFSVLMVFDMIIIVCAVVAMFYPGKVAFGLYIFGVIISFIAFFVIFEFEPGGLVILLPIFQVVCAVLAAFMKITITTEDEFLSAKGAKSFTLIPYESIDYLSKGIFSKITFKTAAGAISCILVQKVDVLFSFVRKKREEALRRATSNVVNFNQPVTADELPEL